MSEHPLIKNCGLQDIDSVDTAIESGARYLGFINHPTSPRHISSQVAATLTAHKPTHVQSVAVMVNPSDEELRRLFQSWRPDILQLHGDETPERMMEIKARYYIPIIKAIPIGDKEDLKQLQQFEYLVEAFLFDTKSEHARGGTGESFDWTILENFSLSVPWFLSGGLTAENVLEALQITHAPMVDVSSGIESTRGVKDLDKIIAFNETVQQFKL